MDYEFTVMIFVVFMFLFGLFLVTRFVNRRAGLRKSQMKLDVIHTLNRLSQKGFRL